jgi:hypothetical protein
MIILKAMPARPAEAPGSLTLSEGRTGERGLFRNQKNKRGIQ